MRGFPLNKETINLRIMMTKYGTGNSSHGKKDHALQGKIMKNYTKLSGFINFFLKF
jgi:hypothetical protein